MELNNKVFSAIFISLVCSLGLIPFFLPINISSLSYENWNGKDLSAEFKYNASYIDDIFVDFNQPTHLYYYNVRGLPYDQKVAMVTLQGLVNKDDTSLFIELTEDDSFWLKELQLEFGITILNISNYDYWNVISLFKNRIKGLVIYDESLIDTVNVATFLASLEESVVITGSLLENFSNLGINEINHDLRGQFKTNVEAYQWAWENYKEKASKKLLFSLDTNKISGRDYVIASKAFPMWLTPGPFGDKREIQLFQKILDESPANIPVWGWVKEGAPGEYEGIRTVSHSGKYMCVGSWSNPTVLSSFKISSLKQKVVEFEPLEFDIENKIYLSFIVSDGDNLRYCKEYLIDLWQHEKRGEIPVGITISPLLFKLNPIVLKFFYESATENDYFVCPPSGAGYCYPDMNPSIVEFLSHTKPLLDQCDLHQVWLLNGYEAFEPRFSNEILNLYTSEELGLNGVFLNYHDFQVESNRLINDVPVFQSIFVEQKNEIIGKLKTIELTNQHLKSPLFVYIAFNSWNVDFGELAETVNELNPKIYKVLRPDHFSQIAELQFKKTANIRNILEMGYFLMFGVLSLSIAGALLLFIYSKQVKARELNLKEDNSKFISNTMPNINNFSRNLMYFFADLVFLFIIKYCLFKSNLVIVYLVFFLLSLSFGILIRKSFEKYLKNQLIILSTILMGIGFLLFSIDYKLVMFLGIPLGIILCHQFKHQKEACIDPRRGQYSFLYWFVFAIIALNLMPREWFESLKWVICIIVLAIIILDSKLHYKNMKRGASLENDEENFTISQLKTFPLAYLFILLILPAFIQEHFYYHLIWGLEFFPSKLTIQFITCSMYVLVLFFIETLNYKKIKIGKGIKYFLLITGVFCFITLPLLIQSIAIIYIINFFIIFGVILSIEALLDNPLPSESLGNKGINEAQERSKRLFSKEDMFLLGFLLWFMILFVLCIFMVPVAIVVDTYNLFEKAGIKGITELFWNPTFWTMFYIPSIYVLLSFAILIYCLLFGLVYTLALG